MKKDGLGTKRVVLGQIGGLFDSIKLGNEPVYGDALYYKYEKLGPGFSTSAPKEYIVYDKSSIINGLHRFSFEISKSSGATSAKYEIYVNNSLVNTVEIPSSSYSTDTGQLISVDLTLSKGDKVTVKFNRFNGGMMTWHYKTIIQCQFI